MSFGPMDFLTVLLDDDDILSLSCASMYCYKVKYLLIEE